MNERICLLSVALSALLSGCGHSPKKNGKETNTQIEPKAAEAFLLEGLGEKSFWDHSSELRCDALKSFFVQFSKEAIDSGKLENFSCKDRSLDVRDDYALTMQLTAGNLTTTLMVSIRGAAVFGPNYCTKPFESTSETDCSSTPVFFAKDSLDQLPQSGYIHSNMEVLGDFVQKYLDIPQTQDLAYGMNVNDFASAWTVRLNSGEKWTSQSGDSLELAFSLTPSINNSLRGTAKITAINADIFQNHSVLACRSVQCIEDGIFPYAFNGHHLVLEADSYYLSIPLKKP